MVHLAELRSSVETWRAPSGSTLSEPLAAPRTNPEAVKGFETIFFQMVCMRATSGSLIHATVGSLGGTGGREKRPGLAA